jgi:hypothetical protein
MTPREAATDLGRAIQQINPLRTAISWTVLVFIVGTSAGMFVRSPMAAVKRANAAQDTIIASHEARLDALAEATTDIPIIKCYVKALYAGETKPPCGMESK